MTGSLNENDPHRLIGSGTIWWYVLVGVAMSLGVGFEDVGFEVADPQARPNVTLSSCCLQIQM